MPQAIQTQDLPRFIDDVCNDKTLKGVGVGHPYAGNLCTISAYSASEPKTFDEVPLVTLWREPCIGAYSIFSASDSGGIYRHK